MTVSKMLSLMKREKRKRRKPREQGQVSSITTRADFTGSGNVDQNGCREK